MPSPQFIHNTTKDLAIEIYRLGGGGNIRAAVTAIRDEGQVISNFLERTISPLEEDEMPVASFLSTSGTARDELRAVLLCQEKEEIGTMDDAVNAIQIVDSAYALELLLEKLSIPIGKNS
jgi:hypothetical protein